MCFFILRAPYSGPGFFPVALATWPHLPRSTEGFVLSSVMMVTQLSRSSCSPPSGQTTCIRKGKNGEVWWSEASLLPAYERVLTLPHRRLFLLLQCTLALSVLLLLPDPFFEYP